MDRLVWVDCEMTGLNPETDELVEVAVVITDFQLAVLHPGLQIVIKPSAPALESMGDFVRDMHTSSGLLDELDKGVSLAEAEKMILDYITEFVPEAGHAPLAGNTIGTDRAFIQKDLPAVHAHLHYRNVDVSSIKELAKHWYPKSYFQSPEKNGGHRALADIMESIRELQYYRKAVFREEPGLGTTELKKLSDAISGEWADVL
jgi:oligoribonuclease